MTHLPADHFLKPLLIALGIQQDFHAGPSKSRGICGAEAPTSGFESYSRHLNPNEPFRWNPGEQTHGYFARETGPHHATRIIDAFRAEHAPARDAEFRAWAEGNPQTKMRWLLRFRDDGRTLAGHMAAIDCERCRVALDALMEAHDLRLEIASYLTNSMPGA